jgi:hypothetical protein
MNIAGKIAEGVLVALLLYIGLGICAMGWSERRLRPVRGGMSQMEVRRLLGEPVRVIERTNGTRVWDYGKWPPLTEARVYFDTNGLVLAIETD